MKRRIYASLVLFSLLFSSTTLEKKWKDWLDKVSYIITPFEREVFKSLKTDKQRADFVKKFWLIRDPVPETSVNEFQIEYEKRWNYVNSRFSSPGKRDGWKTDMGKIYLLLGKPIEIQHYETYSQIYPCQLWLYKGERDLGLPAYFYLIFYKRKGMGRYKLYNPSMNGPEELLTPEVSRSGITRYEALQILHKISPELARASTSYLLSEGGDIYSLSLGGSSNWLLSRIFSIPETLYENSVKTKGIKGYVEVSEFLLSKKSGLIYSVAKKEDGYLLSLAIQPEQLSFREAGGIYKADLNLQIIIHTPSGKVLFERTRGLKLQADRERYFRIKNNPIIIEDIIPVISGLNRLTIILKNMNDKSFYTHDEWININEGVPYIRIIPSFREQKASTVLRPFSFEGYSIFPNPSMVYKLNDEIILVIHYQNVNGQGYVRIKRLNKLIKESKINFNENGITTVKLSGSRLGVGKYNVEVVFKGDQLNVSDHISFYVSPVDGRSLPVFVVSSYREKKQYLWEMGKIFVKSEKIKKGLKLLQEGFPSRPVIKDYLFIAGAYIKSDEPERAVEILKPFLKSSRREPKVIAAVAYLKMKRFDDAISLLKSIDVKDDRVYRLMGEGYLGLGMKDKAIKAWEKSLKINPAQKELKTRILSLKK